jgi:hypothetical protein
MSLKNITPGVDFNLPCLEDMCDGYACDIHSDYARQGCDSVGCDSTVSTYLVELNGQELSLCHFHYYTIKGVM